MVRLELHSDMTTRKVGFKIEDGEEFEKRGAQYRVTYASITYKEDGITGEKPTPQANVTARKLKKNGEYSQGAGPTIIFTWRGNDEPAATAKNNIVDRLREMGYLQ